MSKCLIINISKEILNEFKYDYSYLKEEDLEIELKDLVLESNELETKLPLPFSFVYMFDYEEEQMKEITNYFKERNKIDVIYCGSTRKNLLWTLKELLDENVKEHQTFYCINVLKELIKKGMQLPLNENKKVIEETLMKAFIVLQKKDLKEMIEMIDELNQLFEKNIGNK